jgi:serine protease Do
MAPAALAQDLSNLPDLADRVGLSVVSITVTKAAAQAAEPQSPEAPPNTPLKAPPKELKTDPKPAAQDQTPAEPPSPPEAAQTPQTSNGSGMVLSPDGFIVTTTSVVEAASAITVGLADGKRLPARLIALDRRTDVALIKIEAPAPLREVQFSDSNYVRRGQLIAILGNPFGLGGTVSFGIISALGRDIGSGPYDFLQIDANINPGHSGAPVFNFDGEVVGMVSAIHTTSNASVAAAFAIPSNIVKDVAAKLRQTGAIARGWLGVKIQNVDEDLARSVGLNKPGGALVNEIIQAAPAAASGLAVGDVILFVDGRSIADVRQLARTIGEFAPDTEVELGIARKGTSSTVRVKLGTVPGEGAAAPAAPAPAAASPASRLGFALAPAPVGKTGVLVERVEPDSEAARKGLLAGDLIGEVGGEAVSSPRDVEFEIDKARKAGRTQVLLGVRTGEQGRFVALPIASD